MLLALNPITIGGLLFLYSLCGEVLNESVSLSLSVSPLSFKEVIIFQSSDYYHLLLSAQFWRMIGYQLVKEPDLARLEWLLNL